MRPHRQQPTRVPRPWDSPGKNTGVGCHFLLQCMKVKSESAVTQLCPTLRPHGLQPSRLLHPWDFPGKSTGVGCRCLLHFTKLFSIYYRFLVSENLSDLEKKAVCIPREEAPTKLQVGTQRHETHKPWVFQNLLI